MFRDVLRYLTFSWQVTNLQLILGTKVLVIQRWKSTIFEWKSTIFEGWIIEWNRMNSMMMLNYQSVQKGWKTLKNNIRLIQEYEQKAWLVEAELQQELFVWRPTDTSFVNWLLRDPLSILQQCAIFIQKPGTTWTIRTFAPDSPQWETPNKIWEQTWYKSKRAHILSYIWNMISHPSARGHPSAPPHGAWPGPHALALAGTGCLWGTLEFRGGEGQSRAGEAWRSPRTWTSEHRWAKGGKKAGFLYYFFMGT